MFQNCSIPIQLISWSHLTHAEPIAPPSPPSPQVSPYRLMPTSPIVIVIPTSSSSSYVSGACITFKFFFCEIDVLVPHFDWRVKLIPQLISQYSPSTFIFGHPYANIILHNKKRFMQKVLFALVSFLSKFRNNLLLLKKEYLVNANELI